LQIRKAGAGSTICSDAGSKRVKSYNMLAILH